MVSTAGSGVTRFGRIAINRWRNDSTRDDHGQWCYIRNARAGDMWSATYQPVCARGSKYSVELANDRAIFRRCDGSFETVTEIVVIPGCAAEARRVTVSNLSDSETVIELTSYQEVVLATPVSDRGHRAFGNLFVQTEWLPEHAAVLAMRRPRSQRDNVSWCGHVVAASDSIDGEASCETDRARFIGRGRTSRNPVAMDNPGDLSGTVGAVLDPVMALRARLIIPPGESRTATFTTFFAEDRVEATRMAAQFHRADEAEVAFSFSGSRLAPEIGELGISGADAAAYQDLAADLLFGARPAGAVQADANAPMPGRAELLEIGITGEWPILLATLHTIEGVSGVASLVTLYRYLQLKNITCDVVILCGDDDDAAGLGDLAISAVKIAGGEDVLDQPGGVHVRCRDKLGPTDVDLLLSVARVRQALA